MVVASGDWTACGHAYAGEIPVPNTAGAVLHLSLIPTSALLCLADLTLLWDFASQRPLWPRKQLSRN